MPKPQPPRTYTLPETFLKDQAVPVRWRIWAVINGFFVNGQKCWASNEWLGERVGAHKDSVSQAVKELEDMRSVRCERTRRTRLISPVLVPEIGVAAYQGVTPTPISDRRGRLSIAVSNADSRKHAAKAAPSFEVVRDEPAKKSAPRDHAAFSLRGKLYDLLEKELGSRPTPTVADYQRVLAARKVLDDSSIVSMFEDALAGRRAPRTVREALTARAIDIYRQDNA
jgi:hypothetical protein